jgi:proline dehydrogenase
LTTTPLARIRSRFREAVIEGRRAGIDSGQVHPGLVAGNGAAPRGAASAWLDPIRRRRASAYIAGPLLDDALAAARRLAADGIPVALGYSAAPEESPRAAADVHLAAFERLAADDLDGYVSVKLSPLHFDAALFGELEAASKRTHRRLHLDALAPEVADDMWALVEGADDPGALGIALPGRWRRSVDDALRALDLGLVVRVVKGQWADTRDPGIDSATGFLNVVDALRGSKNRVIVATHDVALLEESLRRLTAARTPCEAELLVGLPFAPPARAARRLGLPVRLYVPYGSTGAAYGVGDLVRKPATAWWLVQDLLLGKDKTWQSIRRSRARL